MPHLPTDDGASLHYIERGAGDETVVFSHSYLADHRHFEPQIEALAQRYRVIAYDHRGHGQSAKSGAPITIDRITDDGIAVLEAIGGGPVHWVGLSTGGFVGMRIALRRPELLRSLVLMDTSAGAEPLLARARYTAMLAIVTRVGIRPVLAPTMKAMFGPSFLADPNRAAERAVWIERFSANDFTAISAFGHAIFGRGDLTADVQAIDTPTLVIVGEHDRATTPDKSIRLTATIPGARMAVIPRAGHLCTVEEPALVTEALEAFLHAT